ncbi:MAG: hypothetical protein Q9213_007615 [Squamulea squamosa]
MKIRKCEVIPVAPATTTNGMFATDYPIRQTKADNDMRKIMEFEGIWRKVKNPYITKACTLHDLIRSKPGGDEASSWAPSVLDLRME